MVITNSTEITNFDIVAYWDISNAVPVIVIQNASTLVGSPAPDVKFWFVVTSPTTTPIHEGSAANPDETGSWAELTISDPWPRPFNQIEWGNYSLIAYAQDTAGNQWSFEIIQNICQPQGNFSTSRNTYGKATLNLDIQCENGSIFLQDTTNTSYQGIQGSQLLSTIKVIYPIDETDNIPAPFSANYFSAAIVPITYSSNNYQYVQNSVYDYDFSAQSVVRIRYKSLDNKTNTNAVSFPVLCNIDLCPLICEIDKLIQSVETGSCGDTAVAQNQLNKIIPRLNIILIGIQQPLCGVDVPGLIEEIKVIGGFDCNCCGTSTGIIPQTSSVIDDYVFSIVSTGGNIGGSVEVNGNNIQFLLHDKKYIFKMCGDVPTTAFDVYPSESGDGFTKIYCLNVDLNVLAEDLLDTIKSSQYLVNLFNSIVTGGGQTLVLDGKCIFANGISYDYVFDLANIPLNTTFALLTGITNSGIAQTLNYSFNQAGLSGLSTYLNSLGLGTFTIENESGGAISISSTGNTHQLATLTYTVSSTNYVADQTTNNTGFTPVTAQYAIQSIINKYCTQTTDDVSLNGVYEVCYIDADGVKQVITVGDVTSGAGKNNLLTDLLDELTKRGCTSIDYILSTKSVNCDSIKAVFAPSVNVIQPTDTIFLTKEGDCSVAYPAEVMLAMLQLIPYSSTLIDAFCAAVNLCADGQPCLPYSIFNVVVTTFDEDCPDIINFQYEFSGDTMSITLINYANSPANPQTVSVFYKISTDSSFTMYTHGSPASGDVVIGIDGQPDENPQITLTSGLVYNFKIVPHCGSPVIEFEKTINAPGSPDDADFTVHNTSSGGGVIEVLTIGGLDASEYGITYPIAEGESQNAVAPPGTVSIGVALDTYTPPQVLIVTDSAGTVHCKDHVPFIVSGVVMNSVEPINIELTDGTC